MWINCVDFEYEHFNCSLHSCWLKKIVPLWANSASTFSRQPQRLFLFKKKSLVLLYIQLIWESSITGTDNDDIKNKQEKKLKTLKVLEDALIDLQDSQRKQEVDSEQTGKGR